MALGPPVQVPATCPNLAGNHPRDPSATDDSDDDEKRLSSREDGELFGGKSVCEKQRKRGSRRAGDNRAERQ